MPVIQMNSFAKACAAVKLRPRENGRNAKDESEENIAFVFSEKSFGLLYIPFPAFLLLFTA